MSRGELRPGGDPRRSARRREGGGRSREEGSEVIGPSQIPRLLPRVWIGQEGRKRPTRVAEEDPDAQTCRKLRRRSDRRILPGRELELFGDGPGRGTRFRAQSKYRVVRI